MTNVIVICGNQAFTYDANGNRLTYADGGANSTYTIAGTSNRLSSISGSQARTYSYNAVGAVTGDGSKTFAYSYREWTVNSIHSRFKGEVHVHAIERRLRPSHLSLTAVVLAT